MVDGREVETTRYNFDALNFPPGHQRAPRRQRSSSTTKPCSAPRRRRRESGRWSSEAAHLHRVAGPLLSARYARRDAPPTFHQVEGLAVDEGITLADLEGTLSTSSGRCSAMGGEAVRTHYFPFTEPSIEAYVSCHVCDSSAVPSARHSGWIEIGGAGIVDPALFEFVGYDPERAGAGSHSAGASSGSRCCGTASPICANSGATTHGSSHSSDEDPALVASRVRRESRRRRTRIARRLSISALEVERVDLGIRDANSSLGYFRVRQGARGGQAPERRPAAALPGRRRRERAAPDRLRRVELHRRRDRCGCAAWSGHAEGFTLVQRTSAARSPTE